MSFEPRRPSTPDWDLEQLEVIMEESPAWQLVTAGPGTGKSAVACQRIAYLVDDGVPPARILLVSFTRTAVAELRDRIVRFAVAGDAASNVRISTIDSHAWSLRVGFDDEPFERSLDGFSYDLSIGRVVELFRQHQPDLVDFMSRLEHLVIDEAQDVMGVRADLVLEMLNSLSANCGATILADPDQAIYGFTADDDETSAPARSLLERLERESPRPFAPRVLREIYRVERRELVHVFERTREEIETDPTPTGHVARIQDAICETCDETVDNLSFRELADLLAQLPDEPTLVLFRRRADVLFASSYCSQVQLPHGLRMSSTPIVISPWIGWLFGECDESVLTRAAYDDLWATRASRQAAPFADQDPSQAWRLLVDVAAAKRGDSIDLIQLRRAIARSRPPLELCSRSAAQTALLSAPSTHRRDAKQIGSSS